MTLILNGTDNSATTPAVTGTDTDTGVYYPAANQVALATNGTQRLMLDGSGAVFLLNNSYLSFGNNGYIRGDITDSLALQSGSSTTVGFQLRNSGNGATPMLSMNGLSGGSLALEGATPVSGIGITFPATQSASSNANTLDDYEEGTWTPEITASGGGTATYNQRKGDYIKIGKYVYVNTYFSVNRGSLSGSLRLSSLPFPVLSATNAFQALGQMGYWNNMATAVLGGSLQTPNDGSTFAFIKAQTGTSTAVRDFGATDIVSSGNSEVIFSLVYIANA
jgi:hypothetical protein